MRAQTIGEAALLRERERGIKMGHKNERLAAECGCVCCKCLG